MFITQKHLRQSEVFLKGPSLFLHDEFAELAAEVFHEVQLALADLVALHDFDLGDDRRSGWENLLNAESVALLADNERL